MCAWPGPRVNVSPRATSVEHMRVSHLVCLRRAFQAGVIVSFVLTDYLNISGVEFRSLLCPIV